VNPARRRIVLIGTIALFAVACAKKKPPVLIWIPAPAAPAAAEGTSTYAFVFDPSNPARGHAEDIQFNRSPTT
jgi:hypothetical protein